MNGPKFDFMEVQQLQYLCALFELELAYMLIHTHTPDKFNYFLDNVPLLSNAHSGRSAGPRTIRGHHVPC